MNENNYSESFKDLVTFIREQSRCFKDEINSQTEFEKDLGITGEDAEELIIAFSKRFKVDISNFFFEHYFNDEPSVFSIGRKVKPLKMGHLEKARIVGRLDDEVINS